MFPFKLIHYINLVTFFYQNISLFILNELIYIYYKVQTVTNKQNQFDWENTPTIKELIDIDRYILCHKECGQSYPEAVTISIIRYICTNYQLQTTFLALFFHHNIFIIQTSQNIKQDRNVRHGVVAVLPLRNRKAPLHQCALCCCCN